jgi:hypothetical protein
MFASFLYTLVEMLTTIPSLLCRECDIKNDNVDNGYCSTLAETGDITTMKDIRDRNVTTGASSRFVQKNNTLQWSSLTMSYNFVSNN